MRNVWLNQGRWPRAIASLCAGIGATTLLLSAGCGGGGRSDAFSNLPPGSTGSIGNPGSGGNTGGGNTGGGNTGGGNTGGGNTGGGNTGGGNTGGGVQGTSAVTFSNVSGTNANTTNYSPSSVDIGLVRDETSDQFGGTALTTTSGRSLLFVINAPAGSIAAGQSYQMNGLDVFVVYIESDRAWGTAEAATQEGTIVIEAISGDTATVRIVDAKLAPVSEGGATGSFTINARLTTGRYHVINRGNP